MQYNVCTTVYHPHSPVRSRRVMSSQNLKRFVLKVIAENHRRKTIRWLRLRELKYKEDITEDEALEILNILCEMEREGILAHQVNRNPSQVNSATNPVPSEMATKQEIDVTSSDEDIEILEEIRLIDHPVKEPEVIIISSDDDEDDQQKQNMENQPQLDHTSTVKEEVDENGTTA